MPLNFTPPVIAHRGACGYAPENTMASFVKAAQLGIKWLEFDVMLAGTGEPMVFHDEDLRRLAGVHGSVCDYPYAFLRTLDVGTWFGSDFASERMPSLREVLAMMRDYKLSANVEIKALPGQDKKTVLTTYQTVLEFFPQPSAAILFSSFSVEALLQLRAMSPDCHIGLLVDEWKSDWMIICDRLQAVSVHVWDRILTEERAKEIKSTGRQLLCYTVNDPLRAKELYSWGVDAVFSDFPDLIAQTCHPERSEGPRN